MQVRWSFINSKKMSERGKRREKMFKCKESGCGARASIRRALDSTSERLLSVAGKQGREEKRGEGKIGDNSFLSHTPLTSSKKKKKEGKEEEERECSWTC